MAYTLTLGKGKTKRQWKLSEAEFAEFESRFEECELIDLSDWHLPEISSNDCEDGIKNGGDFDCDHVHCHQKTTR